VPAINDTRRATGTHRCGPRVRLRLSEEARLDSGHASHRRRDGRLGWLDQPHWLALVVALTAFGGFVALLVHFVE